MGLRKLVRKYKVYEAKELARRKQIKPLKKEIAKLERRKIKLLRKPKSPIRFKPKSFLKAIGANKSYKL